MNAVIAKLLSQLLGSKVGPEWVPSITALLKRDFAGFYKNLPTDAQAAILNFFISKIKL